MIEYIYGYDSGGKTDVPTFVHGYKDENGIIYITNVIHY